MGRKHKKTTELSGMVEGMNLEKRLEAGKENGHMIIRRRGVQQVGAWPTKVMFTDHPACSGKQRTPLQLEDGGR